MNKCVNYLMVRSFLFKTSDFANGACVVYIFGRQFKAFLDENEVLPQMADRAMGEFSPLFVQIRPLLHVFHNLDCS